MPTAQLVPTANANLKRAHPSQPTPLQVKRDFPVSDIFVDPNGKPYKFYIKDLFPNWDEGARKQLEDRILESGGQIIDKVPREGFVVVDPSPEWGNNFGISYKILQKCHDPIRFPCRWVVHWKFIHDTVRLGRLEERLLRECGFPAVGDQPTDHAQSNASLLTRTRVWSRAKNDAFGGKNQSGEAVDFKSFSDTLRVHLWEGIAGDERDQLVQAIQAFRGYTVPRGEEADVILLPDPKSKYKYTPDDITHLKPLIESRTVQTMQRVKFTSWIRMAIREGRWERLWEIANVTLDQLVRPLEGLGTLLRSNKRKRDIEEVEELVSDESPAKVRRVEGRDGSKRQEANQANTAREPAIKPTTSKVGRPSSQFVNKIKQPPLPGKFSSRRLTGSAAAPKRLTQKKTRIILNTPDEDENPAPPLQTEPKIMRHSPDNKSTGASTNPTARSVGPVPSPTKTKPATQGKHSPRRTPVQGYERIEACDLETELEEQVKILPEGKPKVRLSQGPMTSVAEVHSATAEGLDRDDMRTHRVLTRMFAESRNVEAVDSPHSLNQSIDRGLMDLLEDGERIMGNIKAMMEAEYPKLLDIAIIIREFERHKKKFEHDGSEEAVVEEIARDVSPKL